MKFDGDEEYKDPDDAGFVPLDDGAEDEFLDDDLLLDDIADDLIDEDVPLVKDDEDKTDDFDSH